MGALCMRSVGERARPFSQGARRHRRREANLAKRRRKGLEEKGRKGNHPGEPDKVLEIRGEGDQPITGKGDPPSALGL